MKKYLFIIIFTIFLFPISCYATPRVNERTPDDYRVPDRIEVDFNNLSTVMKFPSVDEEQKIYDFSDILSEEEEEYLHEQLLSFYRSTGYDTVIVLTNDLLDFPISDYTYNFYDFNYFRQEGIILVINFNEDDPSVFMGTSGSDDSKVFKIYSDENITDILKYIYTKNINNKEYYDACKNYVLLTEAFYDKATEKKSGFSYLEKLKILPWAELLIIAVAFTFMADVLIVTKYNARVHRKKNFVKNGVNNTTMIIKKEYDKLVEMKK